MQKNEFGVWSIFLENDKEGNMAIKHGTKVKVLFELSSGERIERIPAWIKRAVQDSGETIYNGKIWL